MPFDDTTITLPQTAVSSQLPILEVALDFLAAGLSVVPIKPNGSKVPAIPSWKLYQKEHMCPSEARRLFRPGLGIAVIGGAVSGGLEILDFDEPGLYDAFARLVSQTDDGYLLRCLVTASTPSGGHHCYYRTQAAVSGSQKLAMNEDGSTRLETRGEAGYAIVPPSPAACHPAGLPYRLLQGDLTALGILTEGERTRLLNYARALTSPRPHRGRRQRHRAAQGHLCRATALTRGHLGRNCSNRLAGNEAAGTAA